MAVDLKIESVAVEICHDISNIHLVLNKCIQKSKLNKVQLEKKN
jgi:hypothetical protein